VPLRGDRHRWMPSPPIASAVAARREWLARTFARAARALTERALTRLAGTHGVRLAGTELARTIAQAELAARGRSATRTELAARRRTVASTELTARWRAVAGTELTARRRAITGTELTARWWAVASTELAARRPAITRTELTARWWAVASTEFTARWPAITGTEFTAWWWAVARTELAARRTSVVAAKFTARWRRIASAGTLARRRRVVAAELTTFEWAAARCARAEVPIATFRARTETGALGAGRLRVDAADAQLFAADLHFLQLAEDFLRHAGWQVDIAVVFADVDVADVLAIEAGFVGDGADDVAREHAVDVAYLQAEGFHFDGIVAFGALASVVPRARSPIGIVAAFFGAVSRFRSDSGRVGGFALAE
jgi:hypothetical protein